MMEHTEYGHTLGLLVLIAVAAALYSAVGQGGGSGYLAAMALFGVAPAHMKPAALIMNIFVTTLVWRRYHRSGDFAWSMFWPFATTSVPLAVLGGALTLHSSGYRLLVALALLIAALRLFWKSIDGEDLRRPSWYVTLPTGAVLGFVSGITGVGGGIFLGPLLLMCRWSTLHQAFALSAGFIWVNSTAGILGYFLSGQPAPPGIQWLVAAAVVGTVLGISILSRRSAPTTLQRVLGGVLVIAALKMVADAYG